MIRADDFPSSWRQVPLGRVAEFLDHMRRPVRAAERRPGNFPYYGANGQQGTIDDFIFDEPLVLLAEDGGNFGDPSRPISYAIQGKTWVNNHAHVLRPNLQLTDTAFLNSVLMFSDVRPYISGTTRAKLTKGEAEKIPIGLPPPQEQRRIVSLIEKADNIRHQCSDADSTARSILPALFFKMFGDPVRNSHRLPTARLEDLATVQRGDFRHRPRNEPRFYGGPYPFIQINDVTGARYVVETHSQTLNEQGLAISRMFPAGTVVLSIAATIAASAILGFDSCFPDSLVGIRSKDQRTSQEFLLFNLRLVAQHLAAHAPQLAQKNINLGILNALEVPVPPQHSLEVFTENAKRYMNLDKQIVAVRENTEALFQTLLHSAFTGELTASWREGHMKELLEEMEIQSKHLAFHTVEAN
jgi:type I restriction enzyme S subunit